MAAEAAVEMGRALLSVGGAGGSETLLSENCADQNDLELPRNPRRNVTFMVSVLRLPVSKDVAEQITAKVFWIKVSALFFILALGWCYVGMAYIFTNPPLNKLPLLGAGEKFIAFY